MRKALSWASLMESSAAPRAMCAISGAVRASPSRLRRMMAPVSSVAGDSSVLFGMCEVEAQGKEFGEGVGLHTHFGRAVERKQDEAVGWHELREYLAAGPTRRAGCVVEIGDHDRLDAQLGAVLRDGPGDRRAFRADGETIGGILDIGRGNDVATVEQQGGADA